MAADRFLDSTSPDQHIAQKIRCYRLVIKAAITGVMPIEGVLAAASAPGVLSFQSA
jgi:hypothetical protein